MRVGRSKLFYLLCLTIINPLSFGCSQDKNTDNSQHETESNNINSNTDDNNDNNNTSTATPLTAVELCRIYQSKNDNGSLCIAGHANTGLAYSEKNLAVTCRPGTEGYDWGEALLNSSGAGRVVINWARARECLDTSRQLRQQNSGISLLQGEAWSALAQGACHDFYRPGVAEGGQCEDDWDCPQGTLCSTDHPSTANSKQCLKPGIAGAPCSSYHACGDGLACSVSGCVALISAGGSCDPDNEGADCASGNCVGTPPVCAPSAPTTILAQVGEACVTRDDCVESDCIGCRPTSADAPTQCLLLGDTGDYCRDWNDCVYDLGCVNHVCGTVGENQACGPNVQATCNAGLSCIPQVICSDFGDDEEACNNSGSCQYDPDNMSCDPVQGVCVALASTGPCAFGFGCAIDAACVQTTQECQMLGGVGDDCTDDSSSAPPCSDGLLCYAGICNKACEFREDCAANEYCDVNQNVPVCVAMDVNACVSSDACPADQYCLFNTDSCGEYEDETTCTADAACHFVTASMCEEAVDCETYDGNEDECLAKECLYDSDIDWCHSNYDCSSPITEGDCAAMTGCQWAQYGYCDVSGDATGSCEAKLDVGSECDPYSDSCASGDCAQNDDDGIYRCAIAASGCNRDASFLQMAFLFGSVWMIKRRSTKTRR